MSHPPSLPTVEIVVVNWKRYDLTTACIDSLRPEVVDPSRKVTVVDNGSQDGSAERLADEFPWVDLIALSENGGFAAGVNAALARTSADIVVLLNNDALATPGFVDHLIEPFHGDPELGATTARLLLLEEDGTSRLTNSTGNVLDASANGGDRDWLVPDPTDSPPDVFGFCGGACALRTRAVTDVGLLDESLFMYYEDTDLSWRLRRKGWTIRYVRDAIALHRHASSSGADSELFVVTNTRNRLVVALRHAPWGMVRRALLRTAARLALDALVGIRDSASGRKAVWRGRGLVGFLQAVPATLRQRRRFDDEATVDRDAVLDATGLAPQ
ncbi:glycosyltransferase [Frigoribacterium sp. CFBP 8751]|uniref:glycosyltransferase n=1 Tax=Frigoribacterium sp. CFBP 8751 TaxID=2775277 RepID=UPI001780A132|nr:glycosyltransferase family 2 protein [Frigoribacterium sp. CFBP 8751]